MRKRGNELKKRTKIKVLSMFFAVALILGTAPQCLLESKADSADVADKITTTYLAIKLENKLLYEEYSPTAPIYISPEENLIQNNEMISFSLNWKVTNEGIYNFQNGDNFVINVMKAGGFTAFPSKDYQLYDKDGTHIATGKFEVSDNSDGTWTLAFRVTFNENASKKTVKEGWATGEAKVIMNNSRYDAYSAGIIVTDKGGAMFGKAGSNMKNANFGWSVVSDPDALMNTANLLAGSVFSIYKSEKDAINGENHIRFRKGIGSGTYEYDYSGTITEITTDFSGVFMLYGFPEAGQTYWIKEVAAPSEYILYGTPKEFVVTDSGTEPACWLLTNEAEKTLVFDLALVKYVSWVNNKSTGQTGTEPGYDVEISKVKRGDKVTFTIKVFNQGDIDGYVEEITDYVPDGLEFEKSDNPQWTYNQITRKAKTDVLKNTLLKAKTGTASVDIVLTVSRTAPVKGIISNFAEISDHGDENHEWIEDIDSTPDDKNDDVVKDNVTDEEGKNNSMDDEDDHDIASVELVEEEETTSTPSATISTNPPTMPAYEVLPTTEPTKNPTSYDSLPSGTPYVGVTEEEEILPGYGEEGFIDLTEEETPLGLWSQSDQEDVELDITESVEDDSEEEKVTPTEEDVPLSGLEADPQKELPQTGRKYWQVPILIVFGMIAISAGVLLVVKKKKSRA